MEITKQHSEEYWYKLREVRLHMQEQDQDWFTALSSATSLGPRVVADYLKWEADQFMKEAQCER